MRALAIILVFVTACGSRKPVTGASGGTSGAAVATVFASAKFVPAKPTYVVSARTMRDAQQSLREVTDVLGMAGGFEVKDAAALFTYVLGIDPLSPEAVSGIGVDLDASMVVFSEATNPTFVVHINAPDAINAYFDKQRERGLRTQSVVVGKTEVFTAKISNDVSLSWALDGEWLWVHFTIGPDDGTTWFEHSRTPTGTAWVDGWKWAEGLAPSALVGFFDAKGLLADAMREVPHAAECLTKLSAIERIGFNVDTDGKRLGAKLTFQVGAASQDIAGHLMPPPPGWATARANAPMAADWNLDLRAAAGWAQSCFTRQVQDRPDVVRNEGPNFVAMLDQYGVRTARAFVHTLDPDEKEGTGAFAADLSNARFIRAQLDQIPRRSMFESGRTFGAYKGKHISIPFVGSGDYVLEDHIAIASMGDGLLARIGSGAAPAGAPPVLSIDLRPPGLPVGVWAFLLAQAGTPSPDRFAQRLMTWSDLHVGARLDQQSLVIEAAGTRR